MQLQAYAVAAASGAVGSRQPERLRVTFAYFGTDPPEEVSFEVTDEWLNNARHRIASLAAEAGGEQFAPTPSPACERCDFLTFCDAGQRWMAEADSGSDH